METNDKIGYGLLLFLTVFTVIITVAYEMYIA